jgi:hypothetical protein
MRRWIQLRTCFLSILSSHLTPQSWPLLTFDPIHSSDPSAEFQVPKTSNIPYVNCSILHPTSRHLHPKRTKSPLSRLPKPTPPKIYISNVRPHALRLRLRPHPLPQPRTLPHSPARHQRQHPQRHLLPSNRQQQQHLHLHLHSIRPRSCQQP